MSAAILQSESHPDKETTLALGGAEGRDQSAEDSCKLIVTPDHQKGNPEATQSTTEGIPIESPRPADSMAVQIEGVDTITVLTSSGGRRLAKLWTSLEAKPEGYEDVRQVRVAEHHVSGIREMAALLERIQADPCSCIIRGRFIGHDAAAGLYDAEVESDARRGKTLERPRAGYTLRRLRFFDDQPLHYCFIDVDKFAPEGVDPIAQPEQACDQYIAKHLPAAFHGVTYWWQLSGSAGHPSAAGVLKAHLVFWLERPHTSEEMEEWAQGVPGVDSTVFRRVQVNYTAAPVFASGVADPVPVRSGLVEGWFSDSVDLVVEPQVRERARRTRVARREMVDPRDKDGLVGLFCRTYEIEEVVERWLADVFEFVTDDRLTFLQGGGAAEGACVTDNRQGIYNSHASDPFGGRAANKWDLVRHYVFGHLDEGLDADERALLGPAGWPSHEAMREMVLGLPEIQDAMQAVAQQEADQRRSVLEELEQAIADCSDPQDLQDKVAVRVAQADLPDVAREKLAGAIQARARDLGVRLPIATVRRWLQPKGAQPQSDDAIPGWAREWVYITGCDRFFNLATKEEVTVRGFQARFNREMPVINNRGDRASADRVALEQWCIPTVSHKAYLPVAGPIFEMFGLQWANLYRPDSAPAVPAAMSADELAAVEAVRRHLEVFFENERERRLFISWIAHNVQHPGVKIRWSPYLFGVPGDGKSFWFDLLGAVLGAANVKSINARVLESAFSDWAVGAAVIGIEEVKLHGHNRHDVMNSIKPAITNDVVSVHPKGKAPYTAPNTTNYLLLSNHLDGAPIDAADRRYMFLASQITTEQAERMTAEGYFKALFATLRDKPGALRKWLLELHLDAEFDANGRAPMTDTKREVIEMSKEDITSDIQDLIDDGKTDGVTAEAISIRHLRVALKCMGHENLAGRRISKEMEKAGFRLVGRGRMGGGRERLWVRRDLRWDFDKASAHLQANLGRDFLA